MIAIVFLVSAILKFVSVDSLGVYIYGLGFAPYWVSTLLSRLLIGGEAWIALSLLISPRKKLSELLCFSALVLFSVYLIYLIIIGDDGNCQCFGEVFELSPTSSLLKNIFLLLLLYFASKSSPISFKFSRLVWIVFLPILLILPFILNLPESMQKQHAVEYNKTEVTKFIDRDDLPIDLKKSRRVVCFFSTSCSHCKLAAKKMEVAKQEYGISESDVLYCFYMPKKSLQDFQAETDIKVVNYIVMDHSIFNLTEGVLPLIIIVDNGEVAEQMSNQTFDEEKFKIFRK